MFKRKEGVWFCAGCSLKLEFGEVTLVAWVFDHAWYLLKSFLILNGQPCRRYINLVRQLDFRQFAEPRDWQIFEPCFRHANSGSRRRIKRLPSNFNLAALPTQVWNLSPTSFSHGICSRGNPKTRSHRPLQIDINLIGLSLLLKCWPKLSFG